MKVKRYIANNTQEAMLKVKMELGANAVILHSRKIKRPGITGFFKRPLIEMVAAIEENTEKKTNMQNEKRIIENHSEANKIEELQYQVGNIQNMLNNFINKMESTDKKNEFRRSELFEKYYNHLLDNNVEKSVVDKIMNIAKKQMSFSSENEEAINKAIKIIIREYLGDISPINENIVEQKRIVFVGPTGVGKTTTLAKLAAKLSIANNKSVGFITADTYRIAAVEQLRTYSEILGIPIKVIYEPEEIGAAIESYKDKDIILIDTAGRNHRALDQLEEIKKLISYIQNPDVFLVISAATGYKDTKSIIEAYKFMKDYHLLFTKLDETSAIGNILNTKILTGKNLSYVTTGQSVPDDIEVANPEKIADIIVGELHE
ncbi:flagellar biosynthesis protein FlhF [Crassaminicella thermophila]|uniref:Flagellar biosynthesis protein FlhF n=1 Tax=Crassaminicella thermophila TaxID=2599308 RepID=A0A5C0SEU5_CRATE|nr:flagellar biosynthesis protein FlhF [Crassaminicella thermophila]QEK12257.1 flagellar biosynthesis protein FlhF [Crassaminicella thermophila]